MQKDQFDQLIDLWRGIANSLEVICESYKPKIVNKRVEKEKVEKLKFGQRVAMTQFEYDNLIRDFGDDIVKAEIEKMDIWCMAHGKTYANYSFAVRNWLLRNGARNMTSPLKFDKDWNEMPKVDRDDFVFKNVDYLESYRRFDPDAAKTVENMIKLRKEYMGS